MLQLRRPHATTKTKIPHATMKIPRATAKTQRSQKLKKKENGKKTYRLGENICNTYIKSLISRIYIGRNNVNSTQTILKIEWGTLPNSYYKASTDQLPKPEKRHSFLFKKRKRQTNIPQEHRYKIHKILEQIKKTIKASTDDKETNEHGCILL